MANLTSDRVGQQLGNYRLIRLLGEGGFAEVYLGEHIYLKTPAAIKVLHTQLSQDDQDSFLAEARIIANLKHEHIIQVLEFGIEDSTPFLVMDYAPNGTLRQRHPKGTHLTPLIILPYIKQVADALQYAYGEKLIHRDIKPENMLMGPNNEVLLSDFGIAVGIQSSRSQSLREMAGTATYMAPELLQGNPQPASDQYALGMVIYEWLSGDVPFHGSFLEIASQQVLVPPPPLKTPAVSLEVEKVIMTALEKDPQKRFISVQYFATAFEQASLIEEETVRAQPGRHSFPQLPSLPSSELADAMETVPMADSNSEQLFSTIRQIPSSFPPGSSTTVQTPLTSRQSQPQHRRLSPIGRIIVLIGLVLLVIAGSFGLAYYTTVFRPAQLRIEATATAQTLLTMQPMATAQALQNIYTKATSGSPVLNDPLSQNGPNDWNGSATQNGSCAFTGRALHVVASRSEYFQPCRARNTNFGNFAYQVQITIIKGNEGGIYFRLKDTADGITGYILSINQDGLYTLLSISDRNGDATLFHRPSSAIKTGLNQSNLLTIIVQRSRIYLYINGQYLADVSNDISSPLPRVIGVFALDDADPTDVAFSNALVWQL